MFILKNKNGQKSSHKASQSMPMCYNLCKLRTLEFTGYRSTENLYEARKNEEKLMSKRQTAITRAARHAWSSRPDRSIANCAARRLSMVSTLKTLFIWLKIHDFYRFVLNIYNFHNFSKKNQTSF